MRKFFPQSQNSSKDKEKATTPIQPTQPTTNPFTKPLPPDSQQRQALKDALVENLKMIARNPDIMYLRKYEASNRKIQDYLLMLQAKGFEVALTPTNAYIYKSNDHVKALQELMNVTPEQPLILDCYTVLQLAYLLAYYQVFRTAGLRAFLEATRQESERLGLLHPAASTRVRLGYQVKYPTWDSRPYAPTTGVKEGQLVYVQGPRYAFAFKPRSELNGFNALCVGVTTRSGPKFITSNAAGKVLTLDDLKNTMSKAYREPITYGDLLSIYIHAHEASDDVCAMSPLKRRQAWKALVELNGKENCMADVKRVIEAYNAKNKLFGEQNTKLKIPETLMKWKHEFVGLTQTTDVLESYVPFQV